MMLYNPHNPALLKKRASSIQKILRQITSKHCFITGSYLYKDKYEDIDVFVISRSQKEISCKIPKVHITTIDFNDLHSLLYHSLIKSCVAKHILPIKDLKVTISSYWDVINEAIPSLLNEKNLYHKHVRNLVLYTEYFKSKVVLDTYELTMKIAEFRAYADVLEYAKHEVPNIMRKHTKKSYLRRFFYTQSGYYKNFREYAAQDFLWSLTNLITGQVKHNATRRV